ncbi:hypothetical protein Tco_0899591 [Tanacetum coccineum]
MFMDEIVKSENLNVTIVVTPSNVKTVESNHESANVKNNGDAVEPKIVRKNSFRPPVIEDWNSDDESEVEIIPNDTTVSSSAKKIKLVKTVRGTVIRPVWNNSGRVNHKNFANKMTHPHPNRRFVPKAVLTRSAKINTTGTSVNTAGGIKREFCVARTPQQNGVAERRNNTDRGYKNYLKKKTEPEQEYILIPICTTDPLISQDPKVSKKMLKRSLLKWMKVELQIKMGRMIKPQECCLGPSFTNDDPSSPVNAAEASNAFEEHLFERFSPFINAFKLPLVSNVTPIDDTRILVMLMMMKIWVQRLTSTTWKQPEHIDKTCASRKTKEISLLVQVYSEDIIFWGEWITSTTIKGWNSSISQDKYVADILKKFNFATMKTASTPMEPNKALIKDEEANSVDVNLYRSLIESLMYLTTSRPDIMFDVCACARMEKGPATTASSLDAEQDSDAQTRFETTFKKSNDPPLSRGSTLGGGEDSMKLLELMELCTKLSDLEEAKKTTIVPHLSDSTADVSNEESVHTHSSDLLLSSEDRLKLTNLMDIECYKLEKKAGLRTYKFKRLYKVGVTRKVEYSDDESLDAGESTTRTPTSVSSSSIKDKGKAKMDEPEVPLKKKDQIALDEEMARNDELESDKSKKAESSVKKAKGSIKKSIGKKRAGKEQKQESSKRQRIEDDKETDEHEEAEEDDEAGMKKHIEEDQVENRIVELYFVRTEYQLADIFTKPLPRERFNFLIVKLGMRSMSPETLQRLTEEEDE